MSIAASVVFVLAAVLAVIVVARLIGSWQRPSHPPIDVAGFGAGIVVFTSTDCANCKEALGIAESLEVPIRQVAWELEPGVFERAGVEAVPLTAVVNEANHVELLVAGVPQRRRLRRGVERAGLVARSS